MKDDFDRGQALEIMRAMTNSSRDTEMEKVAFLPLLAWAAKAGLAGLGIGAGIRGANQVAKNVGSKKSKSWHSGVGKATLGTPKQWGEDALLGVAGGGIGKGVSKAFQYGSKRLSGLRKPSTLPMSTSGALNKSLDKLQQKLSKTPKGPSSPVPKSMVRPGLEAIKKQNKSLLGRAKQGFKTFGRSAVRNSPQPLTTGALTSTVLSGSPTAALDPTVLGASLLTGGRFRDGRLNLSQSARRSGRILDYAKPNKITTGKTTIAPTSFKRTGVKTQGASSRLNSAQAKLNEMHPGSKVRRKNTLNVGAAQKKVDRLRKSTLRRAADSNVGLGGVSGTTAATLTEAPQTRAASQLRAASSNPIDRMNEQLRIRNNKAMQSGAAPKPAPATKVPIPTGQFTVYSNIASRRNKPTPKGSR